MDMTGQPRLFVTAVEAGHMQVLHEGYHGWSVSTRARRQGDTWQDAPADFYGGLTTEELFDVICATWAHLLGLADS
jgi:hypothetical protein